VQRAPIRFSAHVEQFVIRPLVQCEWVGACCRRRAFCPVFVFREFRSLKRSYGKRGGYRRAKKTNLEPQDGVWLRQPALREY
jgi:hypothetical protein